MNPKPGWFLRQLEAATREVASWPEWKRREAGIDHLFPPKPTPVVSTTMRMGELAVSGEPGRMDAFHVPAVLVRSDGTLRPKDDVRFVDDPPTRVQVCGAGERHGVVDPLLKGFIPVGGLVWVAIDPELIAGVLTHQFRLKLPGVAAAAPVDGFTQAVRADFAAQAAKTAPPLTPAPAVETIAELGSRNMWTPMPAPPELVKDVTLSPTPSEDVPVGTAEADYYDSDDPECNSRPPCV